MAGTEFSEEKPTQEQLFWENLSSHGRLILDQSIPEGLSPVERTHTGAGLEGMYPMRKPHAETGQFVFF